MNLNYYNIYLFFCALNKKEKNKYKYIKQKKFTIILLLFLIYYIVYIRRNNLKEPFLKIYIIAHKDFINYRYNKVYSIVTNDKSQLKNKYNLSVNFANNGKLYKMKRAYCEMSQIYYIYELYKNRSNSSKYIGFNHYRRYFNFTDNIPDIDKIFENHDIILNSPLTVQGNMKTQFCSICECQKYDEIIKIIKDIKPEYYQTALKVTKKNKIHYCNLFIMKKQDFLNYCKFMFDILFEFDKRNNFTSDDDLLEYSTKLYNNSNRTFQLYQSRLEAFLSERIGNIYYFHHFKHFKIFDYGNYKDLNHNRKT